MGCGDVARRAMPALSRHYRVLAVCRRAEQAAQWRALGARVVWADLDQTDSLRRLAGLAQALLYTAPPPAEGQRDARARRLIAALQYHAMVPQQVVYISTTGVYGDCAGAWVDETRPLNPESARAWRRVDAERAWRDYAHRHGASLSILRAPGIYAAERLPLERLRAGTPLALASEDGYSNHIHADDLAGLACAALRRRGGIRVYHAGDDEALATGAWFDALAEHFALPRAPRLPRAQLRQQVSPALWSFLRESRRIDSQRARRELAWPLRYPTVSDFLASLPAAG
ncbi:MAG: NAD-dependent epimerase/dehydratase family protein [Rivihabitans pingtungensis]